MKRQFSLGTVFRMSDKSLLRRFFEEMEAEVDIFCWDDINRRNIQPLEKLFDSLSPTKRNEAEVVLRQVHAIACNQGMEDLVEASEFLHVSLPLDEMPYKSWSLYSKALFMWTEHRDVFDYAMQFFEIDSLGWWRKRVDLPRITPALDEDAIENLESEIEELLKTTQGRGYACTVETVSRSNGVHYFFAHPDDYARDYFVHDDSGILVHQPIRHTFEVVFAYDNREGSSDLSARLPKRVKEPLEEIFLRNVVGVEAMHEEQKPFDLSMFLDPNFRLTTRPEDRIKVGVTGITLSLARTDKTSFYARYPDSAVQLMFDKLVPEVLAYPYLSVARVRFCFEFLAVNGGRSKRVTFEIGAPFSCSLKNQQPELEDIIHCYLKDWRIEYDPENASTADRITADALPVAW